MVQFLQALINGLLLGGFYGVMVLGFSVIWGVMGIINLAHGDFLMMGAYLAWLLFQIGKIDPFLSLIVIMPIMFIVGYLLQKLLLNKLVERPHLATLLATFGLSISIANLHKVIYTADPRNVPVVYNGSWNLGELSFPIVKTLVFGVAFVLMWSLYLFLQKTRLGKAIRASAQNKNAAKIVGIDINQVYALTAGICIALTAAAGAMLSPIQAIYPFMGHPFTLKAFTITVLGGLGRIPGALLGGIVLGVIEVMAATYIPRVGSNFGIVISLLILIIVLIVRPQGLLQGMGSLKEF
jgi:branched-chain amino acid transport system permease protein